MSSLQASLVNIYPLSTSRLGSSLGPRHLRSLYPWVRLPVGGVPVSGIVHMRSYLPVTPVGWDHNHTFSQPVFLSLPSFQTNDEDRSFGEQWVYPTSRVLIENSQVENRPLDVSMEFGLGSEEQ